MLINFIIELPNMEYSNWKGYLSFKNAVVFEIPVKYVFEYEEEFFDVRSPEGRRARIVVERLPKRDWTKLKEIFPHSIIHNMLELYPVDIQKLRNNKNNDNILTNLKLDAFIVLQAFAIEYRRLIGNWINFHPLELPTSPREFFRDIERYYIVFNEQIVERRDLSLDFPMVISVRKHLPEHQKSLLESYMQFLIYPMPDEVRLLEIFDIFDAAILHHIRENYHISLILTVTSMEAILQWFIFETPAKQMAMNIIRTDKESKLKKKYRDAGGLVTKKGKGKVPKFLIPIAQKIDETAKETIQELMPDLTSVYNTRSSFVHEGCPVTKEDSKKALDTGLKFVCIIWKLTRNIKANKDIDWLFKHYCSQDE